ncbi:PDZ domain-containing protein 9 [Protopterus annectens]|uniref:PDZ domain-containing protein 9 n=1 Tax=Protopterus annectens TaxID=7888 RepID=UPI001CF9EEA4|nr:PDZ domain-containing protein 9 [Protopterus annectens]
MLEDMCEHDMSTTIEATLYKEPKGIGLAIIENGPFLQILKLIDYSPAARNGKLIPGDVITKIGYANVLGYKLREFQQLINALPIGTKLRIIAYRNYIDLPKAWTTEPAISNILNTMSLDDFAASLPAEDKYYMNEIVSNKIRSTLEIVLTGYILYSSGPISLLDVPCNKAIRDLGNKRHGAKHNDLKCFDVTSLPSLAATYNYEACSSSKEESEDSDSDESLLSCKMESLQLLMKNHVFTSVPLVSKTWHTQKTSLKVLSVGSDTGYDIIIHRPFIDEDFSSDDNLNSTSSSSPSSSCDLDHFWLQGSAISTDTQSDD